MLNVWKERNSHTVTHSYFYVLPFYLFQPRFLPSFFHQNRMKRGRGSRTITSSFSISIIRASYEEEETSNPIRGKLVEVLFLSESSFSDILKTFEWKSWFKTNSFEKVCQKSSKNTQKEPMQIISRMTDEHFMASLSWWFLVNLHHSSLFPSRSALTKSMDKR